MIVNNQIKFTVKAKPNTKANMVKKNCPFPHEC